MRYMVHETKRLVRTAEVGESVPEGWKDVSLAEWEEFRKETSRLMKSPAKRRELEELRKGGQEPQSSKLIFPPSSPPEPLEHLVCSRGAPMGRLDNIDTSNDEFDGTMYLSLLPMVDGDYDKGGAYWGSGNSTIGWVHRAWYHGTDQDGNAHYIDMFVRAVNRQHAKELVRKTLPLAKFF